VNEFHPRKMSWSGEDILHIHWPDMMLRGRRKWRIKWRFARLTKMVEKLKRNGGKLVWTVHNLKPHNPSYPLLAEELMSQFIAWVDGFIFLSAESRNHFLTVFPEQASKPFCITPHVHYQGYYPESRGLVSRAKLNIPESKLVLLMFGKLREHKGLQELLITQKNCAVEDVITVVAGEPGDDLVTQRLLDEIKSDKHYVLRLKHIPEAEISDLFQIADAVILPYVDILNSGTAILALSYGVPIIAPSMGTLITLAEDHGSDWVFLYDKPINGSKYEQACRWVKDRQNTANPSMQAMAPTIVARQTVDFYRHLLELK